MLSRPPDLIGPRRYRGRFAPYALGTVLLGLAAVQLGFVAYARVLHEPPGGFLATALLALLAGYALRRLGSARGEPSRRESLLTVILTWLVVPAFGAVPFYVSGYFTPVNALFEAMSGFTTTGATVLQDFATFPLSMFMWRAFMNWVGGIGIILVFIAVFPQLAIAGRQVFTAEAPGPTDERLTPRLRDTAMMLLGVYGGLTLACVLAFRAAGMSLFDAVAHAFSTLAAGGFSTRALSFQAFEPEAVHWVAVVFMFLAGANFALQYRLYVRRSGALLKDPEFRAYLLTVLAASACLVYLLRGQYAFGDSVRHALFQTVSIITTTGFASVDFALWAAPAQVILIALMFIGGSAGSASGGIKVVRWLIVLRQTGQEVFRTLHPRAVLPVRLGRGIVPEEVVRSVAAFMTLYVLLFAVSTAALVLLGADYVTAFTASIACIGNIGPGLEDVGPMLSFAELHPVARGLLTFDMYAGRLEVVTVFALFTRDWWRLPRRDAYRG